MEELSRVHISCLMSISYILVQEQVYPSSIRSRSTKPLSNQFYCIRSMFFSSSNWDTVPNFPSAQAIIAMSAMSQGPWNPTSSELQVLRVWWRKLGGSVQLAVLSRNASASFFSSHKGLSWRTIISTYLVVSKDYISWPIGSWLMMMLEWTECR